MSVDIFDLWRIICTRRVGNNNWDLIPSRDSPLRGEGKLGAFWEVAVRNIDRARRRLQRAEISPIPEEMGPLALTDAAAPQIPSGDEIVPDSLPGTHFKDPPSGFFESSSGSDADSGMNRLAIRGQEEAPSTQGGRDSGTIG